MRRSLPILRSLLLAAIALPSTLHATNYIVTRYDDPVPGPCNPGDCSLREAAIASRSDVGLDRILLSAGTYSLTRAGAGEDLGQTGDLDFLGNVEIIGAGPTMTTLDGGGLDRLMEFRQTSDAVATIQGLSITGAFEGIAVIGITIDLEIVQCDFHDNNGDSNGDYIVIAQNQSFLFMTETILRDNGSGGGVGLVQSEAIITNSTFSALAGISLSVNNDAIVYCNHCSFIGDGIPAAVDIYVTSGGTLQLANTAIDDLTCGTATGGQIDSFGGNLESPGATCSLDHASDQDLVVDAGFAALADNGGPTPSHLPALAGPAVNDANDTYCSDVDQRGITRPDSGCDIGAIELNLAAVAMTPIFADGFLQGDPEAWSDAVGN